MRAHIWERFPLFLEVDKVINYVKPENNFISFHNGPCPGTEGSEEEFHLNEQVLTLVKLSIFSNSFN